MDWAWGKEAHFQSDIVPQVGLDVLEEIKTGIHFEAPCMQKQDQNYSVQALFLLRLGVPQAILLIMATPSCGF
jgi:hypothetical protein